MSNRLAINIVLLPSPEMTRKCIYLNRKLPDRDIVLDAQSCIPHLSLCMAGIEAGNLSKVSAVLDQLKVKPLSLESNGLQAYPVPKAKPFCGLYITKTPELTKLQEQVIDIIKPFAVKVGVADFIDGPKPLDAVWVSNYVKNASSGKFNPHITIGLGKFEQLSSPISFEATKLAICHLGKFCTCRKLLHEVQLK
ncbi:MAG: hypothetical protein V1837_03545 [Candidatus Woesearchaeota archaeon]